MNGKISISGIGSVDVPALVSSLIERRLGQPAASPFQAGSGQPTPIITSVTIRG